MGSLEGRILEEVEKGTEDKKKDKSVDNQVVARSC